MNMMNTILIFWKKKQRIKNGIPLDGKQHKMVKIEDLCGICQMISGLMNMMMRRKL